MENNLPSRLKTAHIKSTTDFETDADKLKNYILNAKTLMSYYRCAILEVETKFNVLDEQFSLRHERNPIESIRTRLKSIESITEKMIRKNLPMTIESVESNIYDIAGVRVICSFIDDIYMLAECLSKQDDIKVIAEKDYIIKPKENGYRSLHLIVEIPIFLQQGKRSMKVEVQFRTIAMEFWANIEHRLRYKKNLSDEILESTAKDLKECAETSALLDLKMQQIKATIEKNTEEGIQSF